MEKEIQQFRSIYDYAVNFMLEYSFQLLGAVFILLLGVFVARKIAIFILGVCQKHHIDVTLANFIANLIKVSIVVMVGIIALGKVGISITPFVAAIGALSLGAGLALQGVFSNYGAGLSIIITRYFKVGDTIRVLDVTGVVKEIRLSHTLLINEDHEEIILPNRQVVGEVLHNSFQSTLVEGAVGIAYDSDVEAAINIIQVVLSNSESTPDHPRPQVGIAQFADSAITIAYRYQTPTQHLFQNQYQVNLAVFNALKKAGVQLPFPQRDVHLSHISS